VSPSLLQSSPILFVPHDTSSLRDYAYFGQVYFGAMTFVLGQVKGTLGPTRRDAPTINNTWTHARNLTTNWMTQQKQGSHILLSLGLWCMCPLDWLFLAEVTWSQVTPMCGVRYASCEALCHELHYQKCICIYHWGCYIFLTMWKNLPHLFSWRLWLFSLVDFMVKLRVFAASKIFRFLVVMIQVYYRSN
jgi:hypothetical protein